MLQLFQSAVYLGGVLTVIVTLFLPAVFLAVISVVYIAAETISRLWEGRSVE